MAGLPANPLGPDAVWLAGRWVPRQLVTDLLALWLVGAVFVFVLVWLLSRRARRPQSR
ncbi:hypothetical protein GR216_38430, partial [Rhizobium leguminosarum]|nr:hypothetical protein [Rhizobium ruizarguesonis]